MLQYRRSAARALHCTGDLDVGGASGGTIAGAGDVIGDTKSSQTR
jgi:hypothetical protein